MPRPPRLSRSRGPDTAHLAALQHEVHELRLAVAALQAEVVGLRDLRAAPAAAAPAPIEASAVEPSTAAGPSVTLLLPLAWAALEAGVPADSVLPVDLGPDTADTEIVLTPPAARTLPEAPLLDPRLARIAAALDELMDNDERPAAAVSQRETA